MKKLLSAILIFAMLVSPVLSGFAAVTINPDYTFTDGSTVYVFGTTDGGADEIGITAGGKDYSLSSRKMYQAEKHGIFGIGLKDSKNILGLNFNAAPYEIKGEEKTSGAEVNIEKTDVLNFVTDLTVGGKTVSGFAPGTAETEFYYGLDALPETAYELPAVSVMAGAEALTLSTEAEVGGFVTTASYKNEKVLSVHFREFSEITNVVQPESVFASRWGYVAYEYSSDLGESRYDTYAKNGSIFHSTNTVALYFPYDIPQIDGYAAVGYNLDGVRLIHHTNNKMALYNYDGTVTETRTVAEAKAQYDANKADSTSPYKVPFSGFAGLTRSEEYKVSDMECAASTTYNGITSSTLIGDRHFLVFTGNDDEPDAYGQISYNPSYNYNLKMTVKYVEKNPKDVSLSDATAKLVTVDGEALSGFTSDKTEYYIGVENPYDIPEIKVMPTHEAATVSEGIHETADNSVTFTVTSADSENTISYKIYVREAKTLEITATDRLTMGKFNTSEATGKNTYDYGPKAIDPTTANYTTYGIMQDRVVYQLFDFSQLPEEAIVTDSEIRFVVHYSEKAPTNIEWHRSTYNSLEAVPVGDYNKEFSARWKGETTPEKLGEVTVPETIAVNKYTDFTAAIDFSKINIVDGKAVIAATRTFGQENATGELYLRNKSVIKLSYVEAGWEDVTLTNANLKTIKVNGGEISGFDPEIDEYYVGVYDVSTDPYIEAIPEINGAEAFASRVAGEQTVEINVIAKDGETEKTYYVYYRQIQEKTLSPVDFALTRYGYMEESGYKGSDANVIGMARDSYMTYRFPSAEGSLKVVSATLGASRALYTSQAAYQGAFEIYQNHRDISMICDTSVVESEGTITDNRGNIDSTHLAYKVEDCSPDYLLGSMAGIVSTTQHSDTPPIELDASKIRVEQGNILAFYIRGTSSGINTIYVIPDLTVEYIVID